jgi:hypothetical protein
MSVKKIENFNIHETPATNQNEFNVETYLNKNFEKTKETINNNAEELERLQVENKQLKDQIPSRNYKRK